MKRLWCKLFHKGHHTKLHLIGSNGRMPYVSCSKCGRWWWI